MAVATAVLHYLLERTKCKSLFITHYPLVAMDLEKQFPASLCNLHMGFAEDLRIDGTRQITFLYRLTRGIAKGSFGVECARLAGLPEEILSVATQRSDMLSTVVEQRAKRNKSVFMLYLISRMLIWEKVAEVCYSTQPVPCIFERKDNCEKHWRTSRDGWLDAII